MDLRRTSVYLPLFLSCDLELKLSWVIDDPVQELVTSFFSFGVVFKVKCHMPKMMRPAL